MVDCVNGVCNVFDCFYAEEEVEVDETTETVAVQYPGLKEGPKLTLYISPWCPYCHKVLQHMQRKGIEVPVKDTSDLGNREELIQIGGKKQVPCLVIDGKALYESNDIIKWFDGQSCE